MSEPVVGIVMGSDSDLEVMRPAADTLTEFGIPFEIRVISAHRTPTEAFEYAKTAADRGLKVLIAAAGGAAHLAGVLAGVTSLPVVGVPVVSTPLSGLDSLLSIVQMPPGVPVACVAVNGARNAALLAVRVLGASDPAVRQAVERFQEEMATAVRAKDARVREAFPAGN